MIQIMFYWRSLPFMNSCSEVLHSILCVPFDCKSVYYDIQTQQNCSTTSKLNWQSSKSYIVESWQISSSVTDAPLLLIMLKKMESCKCCKDFFSFAFFKLHSKTIFVLVFFDVKYRAWTHFCQSSYPCWSHEQN